MYARSNCSVSPATAETAGSFNGIPVAVAFMDSWRGSRKQLRLEVTAPPPKGTQQFGSEVIRWDRMLTASQRPLYHQVLKRPVLVKLRDSLRPRATLAPEEAWQSDPLQQAFSARDLSRSAPSRD